MRAHEVFPPHDAAVLDQLLRKHRPWAFWQACSCVKRTVLLWFYRNIDFIVWASISLYPINFKQASGVVLPIVLVLTVLYL